jgi:hypothetical protein
MVIVWWLGCVATSGPPPAEGPQLEAGRPLVDFGDVYASTSATQWLKLVNVGDQQLELGDVSILGGVDFFDAEPPEVTSLWPGDDIAVKITFDAPNDVGPLHTVLAIASNDPDGELWVDVAANPLDNPFQTEPPIVDFGTLAVGCSVTVDGAVANAGEAALTLSEMSVAGEGFSVDVGTSGVLPWTLAPRERKPYRVTFSPTSLGLHSGAVVFASEDGSPLVQQYLTANAAEHGHQTDKFTVDGGAIDLLIPVQGPTYTPPYNTDPEPLLDGFPAFLAELERRGVEYQISVLASDDGCPQGSDAFITPSMPRDQQMEIIEAMLDVDPYEGITHGLDLVTYAVSDANRASGGCNAGLIRDEADLAVIGYTYIGFNHPRRGWLATYNLVAAVKDEGQDVIYHGIIEDTRAVEGAACGFGAHSLWSDVIDYSGGEWYRICDDVPESMLALAEVIGKAQSRFTLSGVPNPATIEVRRGGALVTDWTYDAALNQVRLASSRYGDDLAIDYDTASGCE